MPLCIVLRAAARSSTHHGEVAASFGGVPKPAFEKRQLRALLASLGDGARPGQQRYPLMEV